MSSFYYKLTVVTFVVLNSSILGSSYNIEAVTSPEEVDIYGLLESPQWSVEENALYWVNNFGRRLYRMDGDTGNITSRDVCFGSTTLIVPVRAHPGYVVVAVRTGLYLLKWGAPGGDLALRHLVTVDPGKPENNIDDGKADAYGRLWFGTFGKFDLSLPTFATPDQGTFYSIDNRNFINPTINKRAVTISNGIAWSLDNTIMYYNDSPTLKVVAFDFNLEKGTIQNEITIFDFKEYNISKAPDGMTIDADGNLWVATFASTILHINPNTSELLKSLELPVDQVSSLMWGGENLDCLYVTTGRYSVTDPLPLSGALLRLCDLGTKGVPENQFVFPDAPNY